MLGIVCFFACYFLFQEFHGFAGLFIKSIAFIILYGAGTIMLKLSPDTLPVLNSLLMRLGIKKGNP